jgi:hypothetical protein
MLTADTGTWQPGQVHQAWAIEFDTEHGSLQTFGPGEFYWSSGYIESGPTGGCYSEPQVVAGEIEIRSAENHYLAVFDDEPSMIAGAHLLATTWITKLPASIYLPLATATKGNQ